MSVHMLGLRFTTDCQPRTKNGCPAHSTTGTDSTSSIHVCVVMLNQPNCGPNIASTVTMRVNGKVHQNLREKSFNSGLSSSSRLGINGSSAMPHFGQVPGWSCRISGCMGHVYVVPGSCGVACSSDLEGLRYFSGSSRNLPKHLELQK